MDEDSLYRVRDRGGQDISETNTIDGNQAGNVNLFKKSLKAQVSNF